jgi:hypothetical protein
MKTRLLKKLRKRFDWKFILEDEKKTLIIYDKKWNWINKNTPIAYDWTPTDLQYLLEQYDDKYLKDKYGRKKMKIKFDKL